MCKAILSLSLICFRTASCKVGISKEMWIKNAESEMGQRLVRPNTMNESHVQ